MAADQLVTATPPRGVGISKSNPRSQNSKAGSTWPLDTYICTALPPLVRQHIQWQRPVDSNCSPLLIATAQRLLSRHCRETRDETIGTRTRCEGQFEYARRSIAPRGARTEHASYPVPTPGASRSLREIIYTIDNHSPSDSDAVASPTSSGSMHINLPSPARVLTACIRHTDVKCLAFSRLAFCHRLNTGSRDYTVHLCISRLAESVVPAFDLRTGSSQGWLVHGQCSCTGGAC